MLLKDERRGKLQEPDEEPQRSYGPNDSVSMYQNEQFTKKETPPKDEPGKGDMYDAHSEEPDEEHKISQRSHSPNDSRREDVSPHRNESDRFGNIITREMIEIINEQDDRQINPEPFSTKQHQKNGSGSEATHVSGTEILAQNKDSIMQATVRDVKHLDATKKWKKAKSQREKKRKDRDKLLRDWALRRCNGHEDELRNVFDQISIRNLVEHSDYPCFTVGSDLQK